MINSVYKIIISIYFKYEYLVVSVILPLAWPICVRLCTWLSKRKTFVPPVKDFFSSTTILVDRLQPNFPSNRVMYYPHDLNDWANSKLGIRRIDFSINVKQVSSDVVIISPEWIKQQKSHLRFFTPIMITAFRLRRKKIPVWVVIGDVYKIEYLIPAVILVAICGGYFPCTTISPEEAKNFGIPFPSGPHIIQLNPNNVYLFKSEINWESRENLVLFAGGSHIREQIYSKYHKEFEKSGWTTIIPRRNLDWEEYRDLNKETRILIASSTLVESAIIRLRFNFLKSKVSKYAITHRIWEGFCSGSLVVTNVTPVLEKLGFKKNVHFLDIDTCLGSNVVLPDKKIMSEIAKSGNRLFLELVNNQV
jgi:hypothetical protein